jgi:hypothetical protein
MQKLIDYPSARELLPHHRLPHVLVHLHLKPASYLGHCLEAKREFIEEIKRMNEWIFRDIEKSDPPGHPGERQQGVHVGELVLGEIDSPETPEDVRRGAGVRLQGGQVRDEVVAEVEQLDVRKDVQLDDRELRQLAAWLSELTALPRLDRVQHYFIICQTLYSNHSIHRQTPSLYSLRPSTPPITPAPALKYSNYTCSRNKIFLQPFRFQINIYNSNGSKF